MALRRMRIGKREILGVSDGLLKTSLDVVIGMDRAQSQSLVGKTDDGATFIPVNNFVISDGARIILIDAGAGNTMQPTLGRLPDNLRGAGIDPADVTHVVLTHIHPDHANGLVDDAGAPHYPAAEIVVHEAEADFWLRPASGPEPDNVARNRARAAISLNPYLDRLRRARDEEEIFGFTPMRAPGHTPGHTCWRFGAGRDAVMFWGDLVHLAAIQIPYPDAAVSYDLDKDMARCSRKRMLDICASERIAIAGAHVDAPGMGYVVRKGAGFAYEPAA